MEFSAESPGGCWLLDEEVWSHLVLDWIWRKHTIDFVSENVIDMRDPREGDVDTSVLRRSKNLSRITCKKRSAYRFV